MAFLVNFSRGGSAIAGDTPAATGEVLVVVSLILKICSLSSDLCSLNLSYSLGDRFGAGNVDILFAVSGNGTVR